MGQFETKTTQKMAAVDLSKLKENNKLAEETLEGLKNILECPVCLEPPTATPIFRCNNGHILCSLCRSNVNVCPECRTQLGDQRCLISEKIVMDMLSKSSEPILKKENSDDAIN